MRTRRILLVGTAIVAGAVLWYLFRPETLVVNRTVNEPLPMAAPTMSAMAEAQGMAPSAPAMAEPAGMAQSAPAMAEPVGMAQSAPAMAEPAGMAQSKSTPAMAEPPDMSRSTSAMAETPAMAHSAMGADDPERLASGRFHSNAHETRGLATIIRLADGRRVLRLTEFATSNGPDVRVYLVAAADAQEEAAVKAAGFVDLGELKGNIGDQNYDIPADLDLTRYRAVSIWCRRFSVNFGAAPLAAAG
jgi:hypothetical protein